MKKTNMKIMIGLIVFSLILLIIILIFSKFETKDVGYIVLDNSNIYEYKNHKFKISKDDDYIWKKYNIYSNYNYVNKYYISKNNRTYFFNDNNESMSVESPFIAFGDKLNIKLIDYKEDNNISDSDKSNIIKYLKSKNINYDGEYSTLEKYIVDLDDNGKNDNIYVVSNQLYSDDVFYVIFADVGFKFIDISFQNNNNIIYYDIKWILSTKEKMLYDIVLYRIKNENYDFYLYRSYGDSYKKVK